jgi:hypothetical protein
MVIPAKFGIASSFSEGLAIAAGAGKWVCIDPRGTEVLWLDDPRGPLTQVNDVKGFHNGLAKVHLGGRRNFIDARVSRSPWTGGAWYYINREGKIVRRIEGDDDDYPPNP